jgi:hypothetical protein
MSRKFNELKARRRALSLFCGLLRSSLYNERDVSISGDS